MYDNARTGSPAPIADSKSRPAATPSGNRTSPTSSHRLQSSRPSGRHLMPEPPPWARPEQPRRETSTGAPRSPDVAVSLAGVRFSGQAVPGSRRREPGLRLLQRTKEGSPLDTAVHAGVDGERRCRSAETVTTHWVRWRVVVAMIVSLSSVTPRTLRCDHARNRFRSAVDGDGSTARPSRAVRPRAAADPRARARRRVGRRPAARPLSARSAG
jgi:hypothetical protein